METARLRHPHTLKAHPGRAHRIELKLQNVQQLFNSMDPSPFHDKDLDDDAQEFIESWAQEYAPGEAVTLHVHLEQWPEADPTPTLRDAVHNFFEYRASLADLEFGRLMKQGRMSLLIGLGFLAGCLLVVESLPQTSEGWRIARESLTIAGWVAMWRPMEIYLYEWWPIRRRRKILAKLARMPVEVLKSAAR